MSTAHATASRIGRSATTSPVTGRAERKPSSCRACTLRPRGFTTASSPRPSSPLSRNGPSAPCPSFASFSRSIRGWRKASRRYPIAHLPLPSRARPITEGTICAVVRRRTHVLPPLPGRTPSGSCSGRRPRRHLAGHKGRQEEDLPFRLDRRLFPQDSLGQVLLRRKAPPHGGHLQTLGPSLGHSSQGLSG